jgi:hypothetical protein
MIGKSVEPVFPVARGSSVPRLDQGSLRGCKVGNLLTDIPQEELACLYQGEPIGENS